MQFLIVGGSGFIGDSFINKLNLEKNNVTIISRQSGFSKKNCRVVHNLEHIKNEECFDVVINLAGHPIDVLWTQSNKKKIIDSRVNVTKKLVRLIKRLHQKPKIALNASAIGYYGDSAQEGGLVESCIPKTSYFSHQLCDAWESEAKKILDLDVNLAIMRFGVVLGKNGGFIKKIKPFFKCCLGVVFGNGKQYFPWIHIEDVIQGMFFIIDQKPKLQTYNFVAPSLNSHEKTMQLMGKNLKRPVFIRMPEKIVKMIYGQMGEELLLTGNDICPYNLLNEGFQFSFSTIDDAMHDVLNL